MKTVTCVSLFACCLALTVGFPAPENEDIKVQTAVADTLEAQESRWGPGGPGYGGGWGGYGWGRRWGYPRYGWGPVGWRPGGWGGVGIAGGVVVGGWAG